MIPATPDEKKEVCDVALSLLNGIVGQAMLRDSIGPQDFRDRMRQEGVDLCYEIAEMFVIQGKSRGIDWDRVRTKLPPVKL